MPEVELGTYPEKSLCVVLINVVCIPSQRKATRIRIGTIRENATKFSLLGTKILMKFELEFILSGTPSMFSALHLSTKARH